MQYLTGIQYLNFIADVFKVPAEVREERIREYSEIFEITGSAGRFGFIIFSWYENEKVSYYICNLVDQPKLLILDEPFVGL